jgi:hypothetical protein
MRPTHAPSSHAPSLAPQDAPRFAVSLNAVIVAATPEEPRILVLRTEQGRLEALPAGPLTPHHRTLEAGLRAWVGQQTDQHLGYVEQLYTFGDRSRTEPDGAAAPQGLAIAYLALVREARPAGSMEAGWQNWYRYFPWEDWREGRPGILEPIRQQLLAWAASAPTDAGRRSRGERIELTFGFADLGWTDERVLERYELLYEAGLVPEAWRDRGEAFPDTAALVPGAPMALDHRRMLATAIARLRGKIKYRPVVFELMPPVFTLLQLQRTVETLAGVRLHKQNFRRLVEAQGLVEETGESTTETGGRPARLVRFRREVLLERPAPGVRLPRQLSAP